MSDFLGRLAARSLGVAPVAQPAVAPMFAPAGGGQRFEPVQESRDEIVAERVGDTKSPGQHPVVTRVESASHQKRGVSLEPPTDSREMKPVTLPVPGSLDAFPVERERPVPVSRTVAQVQPQEPTRSGYTSVVPTIQRPPTAGAFVESPAMTLRAEQEPSPKLSSHTRMPAPEATSAAPVIRVSIGRVEVRAEFPAQAPRSVPRQSQPPSLSIEEYARQRSEGKR
jgi:hypothetical protein